MKKLTLLATALILSASAAYAVNDNSAAVSGSNNDVNQITGNHNVLNAGAGAGSTNLSNTNHNSNVNVNHSSSHSDASSRSTSSAYQTQGQYQSQKASVKDSGNSENSNTAVVNQNYKRNPVSTAYAAPLVAADDTCMGSSSLGLQFIGTGASIGKTYTDDDCVRRKDARELHNMGYKPAAIALMCQNKGVAKAMAVSGTPCPQSDEGDLVPTAGGYDYEEPVRVSLAPSNGSRKN